jgi:diguanylate cyclase (GGDEF)-like protein
VPYDTANVMLADEAGRLAVRASRGYDHWGDVGGIRSLVLEPGAYPILTELLASGRSVLIADTEGYPGWHRNPDAAHVRSFVGVPLRVRGQVIGLYAVDKSTPGFFTPEHVIRTEALAPHAAIAIGNAHLFEMLHSSEGRLRDLNRELIEKVAEFQTLIDVLPIGIAIARDPECRFIEANPYLAALMGVKKDANASLTAPAGEVPVDTWFETEGKPIDPAQLPMQRAAREGAHSKDLEMDLMRGGERVATVLAYATPLLDEAGRPRGAIACSLDITERKRAENEIRRLAYHDTLTGLPNRLLFNDHLELAVAQARRGGPGLAVLFLDVDRFKVVNDSLGHSRGDLLIRAIADRLKSAVRDGDTVARLGGDEFIILAPGVEQAVDAARVAEKVLAVLREPLHLQGQELFATASIGISVYPADGTEGETLVKNADAAMYRAKELGRDGYQLFTPALNEVAVGRLELESKLRRAVSHGELELHYQPLADVSRGVIYGVEALLRWRHPDRGLLLPGEFLALAEATGLILPMGPWVLAHACAAVRAWEAEGLGELSVAVNLSARQFQQQGVAQRVLGVLEDTGLPASRLEIEISESSAMQNAAVTVATLHELKDIGVRIAIDDFGTGYSSLAYLKRFPIDILKIDQSFVRELPHDPDDAGIATAVIGLARTLKLDVVAEGVETRAQMEFLRERGCVRGQGGLFSRALPAEACRAFLRAERVSR